jgi:hypothetical protein
MQVSEGSDTFEFRSPHGMKAAHSRLRTFAGIAVRHLQHFNHPGRAWHDLSGPQDTLTIVLAETGGLTLPISPPAVIHGSLSIPDVRLH